MGHRSRIEPWQAAASKQAAQRKHRVTFFQKILGQPTKFEESAFCNSL
jgi:hypothetical protein